MSNIAIQVDRLSKKYFLGHLQQRHDTLRDSISASARSILKKRENESEDILWALRDISFEVFEGEAIGIIGRNGAGKSTLLKIISQITEPTSGNAILTGRVGSLLEVGTGFHWELTGRENIYLNGAILGMTRKEIQRRFDEIVSFAEIEKFLDTPVKRYSSGMFVRLGFAVAAHLEPEILIVDEVLAVGDTEFQKRCLGKMDDITSTGRTVMFVSHNMNVIQRLCSRTVLLNKGEILSVGKTTEVIKDYISSGIEDIGPEKWIDVWSQRKISPEHMKAFFKEFWYSSDNLDIDNHPYPDGPLEIRLRIETDAPRPVSSLAVSFYDRYGSKLVNIDTIALGEIIGLKRGGNEISLQIKELHLKPGIYTVGLWMAGQQQMFDHNDQALRIEVMELTEQKLGRRPNSDGAVTCDFEIYNR